MKYTHIYSFLLVGALFCTGSVAFAQTEEEEKENQKGWLSASFETNSILYRNDPVTKAIYPEDRIGSNNYLKLDYTKGRFSTGFQLESYLPVLQGYPTDLVGTNITSIYAQWADRDFTVTAGTLYDQFGSGLLFRAWEDRALGHNNALMGARATYSYKNIINLKVLWGTPRMGMGYDTGTQVRGADVSLSLAELFGWNNTNFSIEGSVLSRFEKLTNVEKEYINPNKVGYSGRVNFEKGGFTVKAEYVDNGDIYTRTTEETDPYLKRKGNAQLLELGYNYKGLGIFLAGRRLEWMQSQVYRGSNNLDNTLNYIPAMSMQYTYLLTNLHPFTPQIGNIYPSQTLSGEIGGQADVYYLFRKGSALGGKRGMKVHANFATYYALKDGSGSFEAQNLLFRDFNIDLEKWIGRDFKLSLLYSMQEWNPSYGERKATYLSHIFVADMLYKFNSKYSLRWELQYLLTEDDQKDWLAALVEFNVAPRWSIFASDMYNYGKTDVHYYNGGISYAQSNTRLQLSYGRNKAGYICSGGVCRPIEAYTGFNFTMTISF